jgi:hypothetical protein
MASPFRSNDQFKILITKLLGAANWAPRNEGTEPWRFTDFTGEGRQVLAKLFESSSGHDCARKRESRVLVYFKSVGKDGGSGFSILIRISS